MPPPRLQLDDALGADVDGVPVLLEHQVHAALRRAAAGEAKGRHRAALRQDGHRQRPHELQLRGVCGTRTGPICWVQVRFERGSKIQVEQQQISKTSRMIMLHLQD